VLDEVGGEIVCDAGLREEGDEVAAGVDYGDAVDVPLVNERDYRLEKDN
jgi:hypothetical protein